MLNQRIHGPGDPRLCHRCGQRSATCTCRAGGETWANSWFLWENHPNMEVYVGKKHLRFHGFWWFWDFRSSEWKVFLNKMKITIPERVIIYKWGWYFSIFLSNWGWSLLYFRWTPFTFGWPNLILAWVSPHCKQRGFRRGIQYVIHGTVLIPIVLTIQSTDSSVRYEE